MKLCEHECKYSTLRSHPRALKTHSRQRFAVVKRRLTFNRRLAMAIGEKRAAFVHRRVFVLQARGAFESSSSMSSHLEDCKLVNLAKRLEHMPQMAFLKISWDLKANDSHKNAAFERRRLLIGANSNSTTHLTDEKFDRVGIFDWKAV